MQIIDTKLEGVKIVKPKVLGDERGFFVESFNLGRYQEVIGSDLQFVQDNVSRSDKGVLRGLHYQQAPHAQGKLVSVLAGSVFDVAVDIRLDSPTFGQYESITLSAPERGDDGGWSWTQFWISPGFAHGFLSLEDDTLFAYKCTDIYAPECDAGIAYDDPAIGINWTDIGQDFTISQKDQNQPLLETLK